MIEQTVYAATYPAALEAQRIMRVAHPYKDIVIDVHEPNGYTVRATLAQAWCDRCDKPAAGAINLDSNERRYLCTQHLGGFLYGTATAKGVAR